MGSFRNLHMNVSFDLTVEALSPIHIGTKSSNKNLNFMLKHEYPDAKKLVISGSSMKGLLRAYLSDLAVYFDGNVFTEMVDELFGTADKDESAKGRIFISDMEFEKDAYGKKTINAIPRLSARNPSILTYEVIRPQTKWKIHVEIVNPTVEDFGLIALIFKALQSESIQVGHSKARGFGRFFLHQVDVTIEQFTSAKANVEALPLNEFNSIDVSEWTLEHSIISNKYSRGFERDQAYQWLQFGADSIAEKVAGGV